MRVQSRFPPPAAGLIVEMNADESFRLVVPSSDKPQHITVTLVRKSGQRSRLRVVAPQQVLINHQSPTVESDL